MSYTRQEGTASNVPLLDGIREEIAFLFHHQIVEKVEHYNIPESIILNFDQTSSRYVLVASTTLAKWNLKQVCLEGSNNKRSITATFTITMDGKYLGIQLIYSGKINQIFLRSWFAKDYLLSVNPKHYSSQNESLKLLEEIVLLYVTEARQSLVKPNQKALVIFVVFKGQITDEVLRQYKDSNIEVVFVSANMVGLLQPLDLTVNGYANRYCKSKFNYW